MNFSWTVIQVSIINDSENTTIAQYLTPVTTSFERFPDYKFKHKLSKIEKNSVIELKLYGYHLINEKFHLLGCSYLSLSNDDNFKTGGELQGVPEKIFLFEER